LAIDKFDADSIANAIEWGEDLRSELSGPFESIHGVVCRQLASGGTSDQVLTEDLREQELIVTDRGRILPHI